MPGILAGLLSKVAGLGTLAKGGIAAVVAALTMTVAGGATGVLLHPTTVAGTSASASTSAGTGAVSGVTAGAGASVPPTSGATAHATVGVTVPPVTAAPATVPKAGAPAAVTSPAVPELPACIKNLIPAKGTTPDPAKFIPQLIACIRSLVAAHVPTTGVPSMLGSAGLPAGVASCLSSLFSSMPGIGLTGGSLTGGAVTAGGTAAMPDPQALAACLPAGSIPGLGSALGSGATSAHIPGK
jgi:hypothetical protein